ncbi:Transcriptional regulator, AraC-family [Cupriavidus taiwanensis]|uniref:helix-turn-helix transcriptional regulator n=1 Tax=Cupriavidus taiwanensis TaxID=164546 RepID=UPI000E1875EC|nr:helix-turn-helix transcriptional regulator [Cupriavidus taiwanensis]SPA18076.1 Transcriptional regulator, AraC-family [Cupriavidus taiwanensis]
MRASTRHGVIDAELPVSPDVSSRGRPWAGITVQVHHWRSGGAVSSPALDHDMLAMRLAGHASLEQRRLGQVHRSIVFPGNLSLHPRQVESSWSWDRPGSIVIARVPPTLLDEAADATMRLPGGTQQLRNCFGVRDGFAETLIFTLARELQLAAHPAQLLIAESLSCALCAHLVHRFNVGDPGASPTPGGLHPHALSRVLDFIHGTAEGVTLQALADLANVSRFHFARMFKRSMGETPMAYVERVRLLRAREMIRSGDYPLALVATLAGFSDQSHLGRRFKRHFGCTPGELLRRGATPPADALPQLQQEPQAAMSSVCN